MFRPAMCIEPAITALGRVAESADAGSGARRGRAGAKQRRR